MMRSAFIVLVLAIFALCLCEAQQCPGGPRDVMTNCGSQCEPTCTSPRPICITVCAVGVCQCESGYYRRESDRRCVTLDECRQSG